ncbi:AraC family transcriptional regulator [Paenibacillus puldeungensis]|uniref:AraC family transcriptional regulator n=1 Tax=Paenibacillus puldeungensis TaxID=696536 RepID=A0ABW3S019_9BACL
MADVVKVYKEHIPAVRFVGKKYGDDDRINDNFGAKWGEWFANNRFEAIEKQVKGSMKDIYEDQDAYIGLMRWKEGEPFEYWIGIFTPETTMVPKGYAYVDFPESDLGVCWVYGKETGVYGKGTLCLPPIYNSR